MRRSLLCNFTSQLSTIYNFAGMTNILQQKLGHRAVVKWSAERENQVHHLPKVLLSFLMIFLT